MGFKCGIIGLPNVGKSTLFNALTEARVLAENYPFCTIDPNVGTVPVPDARLEKIAAIAKSEKTIPTTLEFVDIAGLVKGASEGEGLGNQFLEHIRRTQAIAQVVRCFDDGDIIHVAGKVDPLADIETINLELLLADLAVAESALQRANKQARASGDKKMLSRKAALEKIHRHLAEGNPVNALSLAQEEMAVAKELNLITAKDMILVANCDDAMTQNAHLQSLRRYADEKGIPLVPICASLEAELLTLDKAERMSFLQDMGLERTGLERMIMAGYNLLNLLTFFTAGAKETRAWTVRKEARAPEAAGQIHTDFERGFIRAEVISCEDYFSCGGEQKAKEAGKLRVEGKDYVVEEGDIMHFRFNI